jgi:hypothetical protein
MAKRGAGLVIKVSRGAAEDLALSCWDTVSELNSHLFDWAYDIEGHIPLDYVTDNVVEWLEKHGIMVE